MKFSTLIVFLGITLFGYSQTDQFMLWTGVGVRGDLVKKADWMFEVNSRFDGGGVATFFPQIGFEYKVKKWFKPSVEYRFLIDRNKYGNYKSSNRININLGFKHTVKRIALGFRARYQYAFDQFGAPESYNADFDQAFRFKPSVGYKIKKSAFTPSIAAEFFYNPELGESGRQFNKMRLSAGTKVELAKAHNLTVKYQLDKKFRNYAAGMRHVISVGYEYAL